MNLLGQEIIRSLIAIFVNDTNLADKITALNQVTLQIQTLDSEARKQLLTHLKKNSDAIGKEYALLLESYIFYLFHDEEALKSMACRLFQYTSALPEYHYLIWKILISMFQFQGDLQPRTIRWVREQCMRPSYRQLLGNIQNYIEDTRIYHPQQKIKKVALVVGVLLSPFHSPSRNAYIQASGLMRQYGLDVHIINANLLPVHKTLGYFGCVPVNYAKSLYGKQQITYEDDEFGVNSLTVFSHPPGEMDLNSLVNLWNYIEEEQFDAIINLGDVLFATDYFKGKVPILCINTNKYLPLSSADQYLLIQNALDQDEQALLKSLSVQAPALNWSLNVSPPKNADSMTREQIGIPLDAFVYVVVGNRLDQEINNPFIDICKKILRANPANHLCFVGIDKEAPALIKSLALEMPAQVHCFEFQSNLRSFYSVCNVYLNPFRSGGGVSAQMAILEHLPVVSLSEGDVSTCILPEQWCDTPQSYEKLALTLSADVSFYEKWRQSMQAHAQALQTNKPSIDRLYNLLVDLCQASAKAS